MKTTGLLLCAVLMVATGAAAFPFASAMGRTLVVPDMYSTIQEAVAHAQSGDKIFIKQGTYDGPANETIFVNKPLSIIGENAQNTTINLQPAYSQWWLFATCFESSDDAIVFNADDCKLSNLTLVNCHGGAISATGNRIQVLGNNITSKIVMNGSYYNVVDNICPEISLNVSSSNIIGNSAGYCVNIEGSSNLITNNVCTGIGLFNGTHNLVTSNLLKGDYGYSAIELRNGSDNAFYKNRLEGNFGYGFDLWFSCDNLVVANSLTDCHVGSFAIGGSFNNRIYLNNIKNSNWYDRYYYDFYSDRWIRNGTSTMSISDNIWDNGTKGNYWANYNGSDTNGDGVGDEPYTMELSVEHFEGENTKVFGDSDKFPLMHPVDLDDVSVELPAWVDSMGITEPQNIPPAEQLTEQNQTPSPSSMGDIAVLVGAAVVIGVVSVLLIIYSKRIKEKVGVAV
jgi:hypothetical protein